MPQQACEAMPGHLSLNKQTNRRVKLSNLPSEASFSNVLSMVWGGKVEAIRRAPRSDHASILFVSCDACTKYCNATIEGIRFTFNGDDRLITVQPETLDKSDLATSIYHATDASRCLRIAGSNLSWKDIEELETVAGEEHRDFETLKLKKDSKVNS